MVKALCHTGSATVSVSHLSPKPPKQVSAFFMVGCPKTALASAMFGSGAGAQCPNLWSRSAECASSLHISCHDLPFLTCVM